jgi:DGQHR domain-containing protein
MREDKKTFSIKVLQVKQPLGEFYIASIPAKRLVEITDFDVRRVLIEERDVERYLGIQRPLNPKRVKDISFYVTTADACFPTGIIIAIPERCVKLDDDPGEMTISNYIDEENDENSVLYRNIARVLDGQHRLAGLDNFDGDFDLNVCIFIDADIADQANIFSTVNLAQTKVNKSLAYDLYDLMKTRSPQRTCHNIAVTLDREEGSPFYKMIKRLGCTTPGRSGETLTQATFIEPLLKMISDNPMRDRDLCLRKKPLKKLPIEKLTKHPFQHLFVDEKDFEITDIIWNYFKAVGKRWPKAWNSRDKGIMLNRTNGYRAFMRFLNWLFTKEFSLGSKPTENEFFRILANIDIVDSSFSVDKFAPGSSGEGSLFRLLIQKSGLS